MKFAASVLFALTLLCLPAYAQHNEDPSFFYPGFHGDTWTGEVTALNPDTREITITNKKGDKTETFTGVAEKGMRIYQNGVPKELDFSKLQTGMRLTLYYIGAERKENGKKVKYYRIVNITNAPAEGQK